MWRPAQLTSNISAAMELALCLTHVRRYIFSMNLVRWIYAALGGAAMPWSCAALRAPLLIQRHAGDCLAVMGVLFASGILICIHWHKQTMLIDGQ